MTLVSESSSSGSSGSGSGSGSSSEFKLEVPERRNPSWYFTVVTVAFTLGFVFAPYTLAAGGWYLGTVLWVYSYATTWWSGHLIGHCVMDCTSRGVGSSYPEIMEDFLGRKAFIFTCVMQILTYALTNVTLLVNSADWFLMAQDVLIHKERVPSDGRLCLWEYIVVSTVIGTLLAQVPTFKHLLPLAVVSLLSSLARQGILVYQVVENNTLSECEPSFDGVTVNSAFNALAVTAFLFGGHGLFPEEMREMKRPESFFKAFHWSYVIIGLVYIPSTYLAYKAWGNWIYGDIQFNWPLNDATLASVIMSAIWGLIEMTVSHVMMLSLLETQWGIGQKGTFAPRAQRIIFRTIFTLCEGFVAFMFSAAGIANIQGIVGAFGFSALTYYAPFAMYYKLRSRREGGCPLWLTFTLGLAFLSGIVLTVVGVYASVVGAVEDINTYSLFDTSRCSASSVVNLDGCSNPCLAAYGFDPNTCQP